MSPGIIASPVTSPFFGESFLCAIEKISKMSVGSALGGPYLDQMSGGSMTDYRSLAPYKRLQQQPVTMPDLSHTGIVGLASTNDFDQPKTTTARREWIRSASRALDDLASAYPQDRL